MHRILALLSATAVFTAASLSAQSSLLPYAMPDATTFAAINMDQARVSPLGLFLLAQTKNQNGDLDRLMGETGFDPRRDLREVLIVSSGAAQHGANTLVLVRGVFAITKILAAARSHGQTVRNLGGVDVITDNDGKGGLAFLNDSTAAAGPMALVEAAVARRAKPAALPAAMLQRIREVSAVSDAWVVSNGPFTPQMRANVTGNGSSPVNGDILRNVQQASVGVKFGANVDLVAEAVSKTERDATSLADVVRLLANLASSNSGDNDLTAVLSKLDVKAMANSTKLMLSVPETEVEKILSDRKGVTKKRERTADLD